MAEVKDRRASRAWRLTAAATAPADADQHREHRAWRARNWVPAPDATETSGSAENPMDQSNQSHQFHMSILGHCMALLTVV